jgi:hypothetical protein
MSSFRAPSRRDFLVSSAAGAVTAATGGLSAARSLPATAERCIFINLVGGPSQIDTFDPKPGAPAEVRGPFAPIKTRVPGMLVSELFPELAAMSDKFSLIRSMHHAAPPIHECGFQLLNTGHLFRDGPEWPSVGAVASYLLGSPEPVGGYYQTGAPERKPWWVCPHEIISTGVNVSRGQGLGFLATLAEPAVMYSQTAEMAGPRHRHNRQMAHQAAQALDRGARFVTVNMFDTVFDSPSWDCHADGGSLRTDLNDIRTIVAPMLDDNLALLLTGLEGVGLLDSTLVIATGEFGRTPRLNSNGGRDHWAGAWTALVAGGGVKGGRVIGRTDAIGSEPADRPVSPQELVATIYHALGIAPDATIPGPAGRPVPVYPSKPVIELF